MKRSLVDDLETRHDKLHKDESPIGRSNALNGRRLRPEAFKPSWAMECFLDRALDHGNPQAGLFAIAYSLAAFLEKINDEVAADSQEPKP